MENKTSKYFKYAIGEIVLVIIGILIALQINNWNESNKKAQKIEILLTDLLKELEQNIEASTEKLPYFHQKDSVFRAIMFKKVTADVYKNDKYKQFKYMMNDARNVTLSQESFDVLIANLDEVPIEYKTITKDLIHLNTVLKKDVDVWNEEFASEFKNYVKYEVENYTWFSEYSEKGNKPIIDYYLNDPMYKNKVAYMYDVVIQNLLNNSLVYRKAAIKSYTQIAKLLDKELNEKNTPWLMSDKSIYEGNYKLQSYIKNGFIWGQKKPTEKIKIFKAEKRLYILKGKDSTKLEVILFLKHQFISEDEIFYTLKIQGKDTIVETNGGAIYKKNRLND